MVVIHVECRSDTGNWQISCFDAIHLLKFKPELYNLIEFEVCLQNDLYPVKATCTGIMSTTLHWY